MKSSLFLLIFFPVLMFSQMTTDRPGDGTSSEVLRAKSLQLESGTKYNRDAKNFSSDHLFRFGITNRWEVRLETELDFSDPAESTYGFSSKYNFLNGEDSAISLTLIGASDFDLKNYSFLLAADRDLTDNLGWSANLGYKKEDLDFLFVSFGLEYEFNEKWGIAAEYSGDFNSILSPAHHGEFGLTFLASPRLKLDVSAGSSLQDVKSNYFLGAGVSYRFN